MGVNIDFQGKNFFVGQQVINYIKTWFNDEEYRTGCRFLVVDAYNKDRVLQFYIRNKFKYLYKTEEDEREATNVEVGEKLHTRLMFLDLLYTELLDMPNV